MGSGMVAASTVTEWTVITDLVVILVSAAVVAVVMQRMRLAATPSYSIARAVIGPRAPTLLPSPACLGVSSHLAIPLLLFCFRPAPLRSILRHRPTRLTSAHW